MCGKTAWWRHGIVILAVAFSARSIPSAQTPVWRNVTGNLANLASECGNLTLLSAQPGSKQVDDGWIEKVAQTVYSDR